MSLRDHLLLRFTDFSSHLYEYFQSFEYTQITSALSAANSQTLLNNLITSHQLYMEAVEEAAQHSALEHETLSLENEINVIDNSLQNVFLTFSQIDFSLWKYGQKEQFAPLLPTGNMENQYSLEDILLTSEKMGKSSFAPADFIEKKGLANTKPPAPMETMMVNSLLHMKVQDMANMALEMNMKKKEEEDEKKKNIPHGDISSLTSPTPFSFPFPFPQLHQLSGPPSSLLSQSINNSNNNNSNPNPHIPPRFPTDGSLSSDSSFGGDGNVPIVDGDGDITMK